MWTELKARLLHAGTTHLTGVSADDYIARSRAGPGQERLVRYFFAWMATGSGLAFRNRPC
jgi:hypothetical protein